MFSKPVVTIFMNVIMSSSKFDITTGASVDEIRDTVLVTFIVTLLLDNVLGLFAYSTVLCNCTVF